MKKVVAVAIVALFAGGGTMAGISHDALHDTSSMTVEDSAAVAHTFSFSSPEVSRDGWLTVDVDGCTTVQHEGEPMLPYTTHTMTFPLGTAIQDVQISLGDVEARQLDGTIAPAARPMRLDMQPAEHVQEKGPVYQRSGLYPADWVQWNTGAGLHHGEHVTFLTLQAYPARYAPQVNRLQHVDNIDVTITYNEPTRPLLTADEYDLLIVTPEAFTDALQPLVQHKEDNGLATKMVTLKEIYRGRYFGFGGRDEAERVKYFIKNALEDWGIRYVMLVGGRHGGLLQEKWWCPVRYSHLDDGSGERQYLSDLYFADVYQQDGGNEIAFASWDTNDNGVYAEWQGDGRDRLDMYPDVAVGRLACRNRFEVTKMVEKIIAYETGAAGSSWAKRFVGIAGDTYPASGNRSYYEGELATEAAFSYLDGYESDFRWTSTGTLESADDIVAAISQGAGFVHFSGHGNPMDWATHKPRHRGWIHFDVSQFERLSNQDTYPVAVVGGCHNNQFNVSVLNLLNIGRLQETVDGHTYAPECWGWWLARTFDGGAVATVANTGYGYGQPGEDCLEKRGRYMELMFFKSYAEGTDRLGMTHAQGQTKYIHAFPPMDDRVDCKIVQEWVLLGDPSLKIGGYP